MDGRENGMRLFEIPNGKAQSNDKIVLIVMLGTLEALKTNKITTSEAELVIFSPWALELFSDVGIDRKIIEVVQKGCFLEDIESLMPDKLAKEIDDLQEEALDLMGKCDEILPYGSYGKF